MAQVFTRDHQPRIPVLMASYFAEALFLPAVAVLLSFALL
jgi:hypothetical protein